MQGILYNRRVHGKTPLAFLICMMEHITKYHIQKQSMKLTFITGLDVEQLIDDVLTHPLVKQKHRTKPNRCWYMGKFSKVIGYRGYDGAECCWLVVLMDLNHLITSYPIPHPRCLRFFS